MIEGLNLNIMFKNVVLEVGVFFFSSDSLTGPDFPRSQYIAQFPKFWDYKCQPPCLAY